MNPLVLKNFLEVSEYLLARPLEAKFTFDDLKAAAPGLAQPSDLQLQPLAQGEEAVV